MSSRLIGGSADMAERFARVRKFSKSIRASEYSLTSACNIRCTGCWFFEHKFDETRDEKDIAVLRSFIETEVKRGVNAALLIGGEPTLFPERVAEYVRAMEFVTISSNGLHRFPVEGFETVAIALSLFGGGPVDDHLRAIKPSGKRFTGLFDKALANYHGDRRAHFVYALTESAIEHIDETVSRIADNGNAVTFNFYSAYDKADPLRVDGQQRLLDEVLRVHEKYRDIVTSTPLYIEAMITGKTSWGQFGYDVCPSISVDHPAHADRLKNGNLALAGFNAWGSDLKTLNFCCTSGHCEDCRDSQAVLSWLLVSPHKFARSPAGIEGWVELAESYWAQFAWSPYHQPRRPPKPVKPVRKMIGLVPA
jgi:MoaA/NifB/PqqE/SkfB family radical SAM enzyme